MADATAKPRYYAKDGKMFDAGVEIKQESVDRMLSTYPKKIEANTKSGADFPPAAKASALANEILNKDLREIRQMVVDRDTAQTLKK